MSELIDYELRKLFINHGPVKVMERWEHLIQEMKQFIQQVEKPKPLANPIILKDVLVPSEKVETPDKDIQKNKVKLHKEAIQKKRSELASQGIIPETQLTEENLKKWIQQEKKNYWTIAELTGCSDNDISSKAKHLNIYSDVALMIRRKKLEF